MLVLDEPTAQLDPSGAAELLALLARLRADRRHTLVIVEHRLDEVMPLIEDMAAGNTPVHARMGVGVDTANTTDDLITDGAVIREINPGSAAEKAGLEVGDVITKVDDTVITDSDSLIATVRSYRPGDKVTVTFTRDGDEQTVKVTLESDAALTNG